MGPSRGSRTKQAPSRTEGAMVALRLVPMASRYDRGRGPRPLQTGYVPNSGDPWHQGHPLRTLGRKHLHPQGTPRQTKTPYNPVLQPPSLRLQIIPLLLAPKIPLLKTPRQFTRLDLTRMDRLGKLTCGGASSCGRWPSLFDQELLRHRAVTG